MRYGEDDDGLFCYDGFTNPEDIFYWIFKIDDTLQDIPDDKHVEQQELDIEEKRFKLGTTIKRR